MLPLLSSDGRRTNCCLLDFHQIHFFFFKSFTLLQIIVFLFVTSQRNSILVAHANWPSSVCISESICEWFKMVPRFKI